MLNQQPANYSWTISEVLGYTASEEISNDTTLFTLAPIPSGEPAPGKTPK